MLYRSLLTSFWSGGCNASSGSSRSRCSCEALQKAHSRHVFLAISGFCKLDASSAPRKDSTTFPQQHHYSASDTRLTLSCPGTGPEVAAGRSKVILCEIVSSSRTIQCHTCDWRTGTPLMFATLVFEVTSPGQPIRPVHMPGSSRDVCPIYPDHMPEITQQECTFHDETCIRSRWSFDRGLLLAHSWHGKLKYVKTALLPRFTKGPLSRHKRCKIQAHQFTASLRVLAQTCKREKSCSKKAMCPS